MRARQPRADTLPRPCGATGGPGACWQVRVCPCPRVPSRSPRPRSEAEGARPRGLHGARVSGAVADGTEGVPRQCRLPRALGGTRTFPAMAHGEHWEWAAWERVNAGRGRQEGTVWGPMAEGQESACPKGQRLCVTPVPYPVRDSGTETVTGQSWIAGLDPGVSLLSPPLRWPAQAGRAAVVGLRILTAPQHLQHPHPPPHRVPSRFLAQGLGHPGSGDKDCGADSIPGAGIETL